MNTTEREIDLIEKAAKRAGMVSLLNHGAASCVYSEGCNGVTQEHLMAFAREIALHCATALYQPNLEDAQGEIRALRATEAGLREMVKELEEQLEEARKDAMHEAALICDALPAPPSCNVLERNLWDVATVAAADAIRAAIKEQT